jgi:hypothetical protein
VIEGSLLIQFREQRRELQLESRQDQTAIEQLALMERDALVRRGVGVDRASSGIHDPDESDTGVKIFLALSPHLGGSVSLAEDLSNICPSACHFAGGTRLIWIVHPDTRTVHVHLPGGSEPAVLGEEDSLDGFDVLPGFSHSVAAIFAEAQRPAEQV